MLHRFPEDHGCTFDYKKTIKPLEKVVKPKLQEI